MSKDKNVVRVVMPVYPVVERTHLKVLQDGGFVNEDGYLDILALMHSSAVLERRYQLKITAISVTLGVIGGLALKFLI